MRREIAMSALIILTGALWACAQIEVNEEGLTPAQIDLAWGNAYYERGEYDNAINRYNQALEKDPDFAEAYYKRGTAYRYKGEMERALEDFRKAIELRPDYKEAYNALGALLVYMGEVDEAIREFKRALEIDPNFGPARRNLDRIERERQRGKR
ncbi:MAG: tetratricopeptide repeat protein [bacterium]